VRPPWLDDGDVRLYHGEVREVLRELPAESVHCVVTSPPYFQQRDYGEPGQIGLEATPTEFVEALVETFREVRRVLRADGTMWLNLGDSYVGGGGYAPDAPSNVARQAALADGHNRDGAFVVQGERNYLPKVRASRMGPPEGLKAKDMVGAPWRVALALQDDGWWLRRDVIWHKPNPMPEAATDRPTTAHEYLFLLTKASRYFFDAEAVREQGEGFGRSANFRDARYVNGAAFQNDTEQAGGGGGRSSFDGSGRNLRSVWTIPTENYPGAHFATFPQKLVEPCVKAGTSERGCCGVCGAPWAREVQRRSVERFELDPADPRYRPGRYDEAKRAGIYGGGNNGQRFTETETVGWAPTCSCNGEFETVMVDEPDGTVTPVQVYRPRGWLYAQPVRPCAVFDPFLGSGTTALVARRLGRHAVGVELKEDYLKLAARRLQQLSLFA
jgi:DNA modification methylase